ncbi:MAG: class I SAM-dependent RNA methyltransferase [Sandaracinaceae bacterium]|nr:class I SAM-dependent RNA methyltransferase [Sandaracinaceae bacterium]MBP7685697.1 class I SAM-dependent RNA methyltransferase [Deltaproteobacteria bacterium]MBK7150399.1 class I SAM-dependent RNA methyltransferase [Sandaracinaceae bacterium]MBK7777263.1 class I SAM-dependent RNA methyltransferase [Sandaracinaceae bacterium]MBK8408763.1 class I SAM-dependent RNA methyltransferase [Sandaracinaceae bacterium]
MRAKRPVAQKGGPAAPLPRFVDGRVTQLAMGGDGVVQTELGDVFRAGVFPGERVRLKGLRRQGKLLLAGDAEVLEASAQRRAAPCVHAEACGGCAWMALAPEAQRDARRTLIERALTNARVTPLQPVELDPAGLEQDLGYRSRARMRFEGGVLGYRASGSRRVVPIAHCVVQSDAIASAVTALGAALTAAAAPGGMDVHLGHGERGVVVELRSDGPLPPTVYAAMERLVQHGALQGVGILAGGATSHAVFGDPAEAAVDLTGQPLSVPLAGFSQANPAVNQALVATAVLWAEASGQDTLELYSGSGNLSVALAASGAQLTAVERDEAASALAMRNLAARGLSAKVLTGNAADSPSKRFSRVVLDPPREGAEDAVGRIARVHRPDRIVYVSCDPRTLARDIATLVHSGYQLARVRGFDMFPQTPHVETVALLTRAAPT